MSGSTVNPLKYNAESEGNLWVAVSIPVLVLTYITGALRLWWRYRVSGRISASDWCVIISLVRAQLYFFDQVEKLTGESYV